MGSGIYNWGGTVTVTGSSQITDNTATTSGNSGGGIYTTGGTVTVYYCAGVTISGNTPVNTSGPITTGTCV